MENIMILSMIWPQPSVSWRHACFSTAAGFMQHAARVTMAVKRIQWVYLPLSSLVTGYIYPCLV